MKLGYRSNEAIISQMTVIAVNYALCRTLNGSANEKAMCDEEILELKGVTSVNPVMKKSLL